MSSHKQGILITCEPAIKTFIIWLQKEINFGFVSLDDSHLLLINADNRVLEAIQKRLDAHRDENAFSQLDQTRGKKNLVE
jgi:hypothetical protein